MRLYALFCASLLAAACLRGATLSAAPPASAYLFTSFRDADQKYLRFLYSLDGYHWTNVPGTFLEASVGTNQQFRDPSLTRGSDGRFHLVWTAGWHGDQGFGCASSPDLIHWSDQQFVPVMTNEPATVNVWAPEIFHDDAAKDYVIAWASTIPGRFPDLQEKHDNNHRLYFTTTRDFQNFAPEKLFLDPGFSAIDPFILKHGDGYVLVFKDNSRPNLNLRVAFGSTPLGPWTHVSAPFTQQFTEGPCALKVGDDWLIYFDAYRQKIYGAVKTRDFQTFTDVTKEVSFPPDHKHGTALQVPLAILDGLLKNPADTHAVPDETEAKYSAAIEGRTADILKVLALSDPARTARVHDGILAQYRALRAWHDANDARLKAARGDTNAAAQIRASLKALHAQFLSALAENLSPGQIEQVKDKLTYGKVQFTFNGYVSQYPQLTDANKAEILRLLKEAREDAMDGGSAAEKTAVFQKYKGRINNYLSASGQKSGKAAGEPANP